MQVEEMYNISQHFKVKVTIRINVEIKVSYLLNWKPTNFKHGTRMKHDDPYIWQAPWAPRLKVKFARSRGPSDRCWLGPQVENEMSPKTSKLLRRLPTSRAITRTTRFELEVKRSKVNVTRPINTETESVSPTNLTSNLIGGWSMRYQLPWPAIKASWSWVIGSGVTPIRQGWTNARGLRGLGAPSLTLLPYINCCVFTVIEITVIY